jgi:CRP/FNR family transcriptional regulator, cyclic AMP receptor protein
LSETRGDPAVRFGVVRILECDPDLAEDLSDDQVWRARDVLVARSVYIGTGAWEVGFDDFEPSGNLGLLVVDGLLAREVTVGEHGCAELLGPGDVLQPWLRIGPDNSVATDVVWDVLTPMVAAVLDRELVRRVAPWPEIAAAVARRLGRRTHWLAFQLAVCALRRLDDRLLLVLWHLADRWGRMTSNGVRLDLRLTHGTLAAAVGARRPSVTVALKRLTELGRVEPRPGSRWVLHGRPPAELESMHRLTAGGGSRSEQAAARSGHSPDNTGDISC